jgi:hypothetical protein
MKLLESVDRRKLIYEQKYYMKRNHRPCIDIIFYGYMEFGDVIDSDSEFEMDNFAWVKCLNSVMDIIEIDIDMNEFYRSVTKEEYYSKLKEKYDRKVLNIILKRLVDESFQSDYL